VIEPRTKSERDAYVHGYANAVLDVRERGMKYAHEWLREMFKLDHPDLFEQAEEDPSE
jgi:hypothetical protein